MSDYDELDDQLSGALEHAATPADPGGVFDNVVAKKKHRADMRSLRIRGAALLSVVVLAATLAVATSGGSRPKTTNVASGETPTSSQEGDGVVNPQGAVSGGDSGSTTTSTPNASAAHGSKHGTTTTAPAGLGPAVAIDNGPQVAPVVTCQRPTPVTRVDDALGNVHFVDAQHGWAVPILGWEGVLITTDGGKTWLKVVCDGDIRDVAFVDAGRGWAAGDRFILSTTDGGRTWVQQSLPAWPAELDPGTTGPWSLFSVSFPDATHGWAVGNSGAVLATSDGGAHWISQASPQPGSLSSVAFADDQHGGAVGGMGGEVGQLTGDGGKTWVTHNDVGYAVDFVDAAHAWAGGYGVIRMTNDGGATWHDQAAPSTSSAYTRIHFVDLQHGWAVSPASGVVATTDGGAHWQAVPNAPANTLDVSFVDSMRGWAVGTVIATTNDGGMTWATQAPNSRS